MKWYFPILGALLLIFFSPFIDKDLPVVLPVQTEGKKFMIPVGALWFDLTSSEPIKRFALAEFYPDQSFIGRYDIKIEGNLYLEDYSPACSVICRNLWNSSDVPHEMSTSDFFHETYTYSYSQPTIHNSDFSIQLELKADTEISTQNPVKGWFLLKVIHDGVTEKPDDFTMPTPVDTTTATDTTETETIDSNSKQEVSFTNSFICFLSLGVLFLMQKKFK
ncbi:MAG: hypothetical protein ACFFBQ_18265 [Promethearchaeota archaeon]